MRPVFAVGFVPSAPIDDDTVATSGSARMTSTTSCWSSIMRWNDTSGAASVTPLIVPVSSIGKNPFGTWIASTTVSATVASVTSSVVVRWRSTTCSVRS